MGERGSAIRGLLTDLYGDEAAAGVFPRVMRAIKGCAGAAGPPEPWSERDAWLITYPDQFRSAGEKPLATLRRFLASRLPSLNGVHLLPFHPSSSDEGFSVVDYSMVEGRYGTWDDVTALAGEVRLMTDAVVNHMSARSRWFRAFLDGDSAYDGFFRTSVPDADLSRVVRPRAHPLLTRFEAADGPRWVWTTFSADQVDFDYRNPEVLLRMLDVLLAYVGRGAAVVRLDAVAFLWKEEGTPSIHLPQTHLVIRFLRACLDEVAPGVLLVTETNVPHEENVAYFGDGTEAQMVYQFTLPPLVLHAFITGDATALRTWASGLEPGPVGTTSLNFLASHDGVGLRPLEGILDPMEVLKLAESCLATGGRVTERSLPGGGTGPYELNSTWFDLLGAGRSEVDGLARHLASHAVMLAMPGVPLLYVHSLFGSPNDHAAVERTGSNRSINRARFHPVEDLERSLDDPHSRPARCVRGLGHMLEWRSRSPAFHPDAVQRVLDAPPLVFAVERQARSGERARVAVNVGDRAVTIAAPDGSGWRRLETGRAVDGSVRLGRWQSVWMENDRR